MPPPPRPVNPRATSNGPLRRLSCGVLILNARRELLLCHVTGQPHWDLPKGGIEPGETPLQAALRETVEETGLQLDPGALLDLGRLAYTAKKDLHLFAVLEPRFEPRTLHCASHFLEHRTGRRRPEMDAFGWFALQRVRELCTPNMQQVLTGALDLDRVLRRLAAAQGEPATAP